MTAWLPTVQCLIFRVEVAGRHFNVAITDRNMRCKVWQAGQHGGDLG